MNRRAMLRSTLASGALAALPLSRTARADASRGHDSWQRAFHDAVAVKPQLLGFQGTNATQFATPRARLDGKIPAALRGTLYRNGPARHEIGNYRFHHWFDGDGMVQAYRFTDAGINHQGRMIATHKYVAESLAGRPLYPGFGSLPPNTRAVTGPDSVNVANISMLHHASKLLALWEAGSPHEIDPDTLETRGVYAYAPEMRGVAFSAHPRVEPDGTLWNFGYVSGAGLIVLWHIDASGKLVKAGRLPVNPISMPHDFVVTDRHLVILNPPLDYEPGDATNFLDAHVWHPQQPTRVIVVNKNDFSDHFTCELPAQWVFHFGNAWEDEA
ncbi:MAG: carotenoid oxygenase, partial [Gammaproteobacteria bacterium]|nr:carotenoid oxygenase [Gammaproteobacteria bacterium]